MSKKSAVVLGGTLGSTAAGRAEMSGSAGGVEVDGTLGRSSAVGMEVLVALEKISLSFVKAWRVWASGGGDRG